MRINFIRHGLTEGNKDKKYIGRTDECLCHEGKKQLVGKTYPLCTAIGVSPMKRCIETAEIIYPNMKYTVCNDFRECDFGNFEGKNYIELSGDPDYQRWIDSEGNLPFPAGENPDEFKRRSVNQFLSFIAEFREQKIISLVVHGGTIMSIMEKFAFPKRNYYDYSIKNGECLISEFDGSQIKILEKI